MSFPEKALQTRPVCAAENGACVNRRGRGWSWTPGRTPEEVLCLCDLSFLENPNIQMCLLQGKGRRGDTGSQTKLTAYRSPPPGPLSVLTFVGFNQSRSKGGTHPSARDQQAPPLSPQPSAHLTWSPGREIPGRKVSLSSRVSEPDTVTLSINEAETSNSESLNF